ncbi:MAG: RagB/SusD family nutrient uptake outer membrane protein [Prevotella sp.]|nr:RagB/SusD family nutrient uptake outer membrane protein [Prevotella sp.]
MKKYIYILSTICLMGMTSCDSFLEREPLDFGNEETYFKTADDLKIFVNDIYSILPKNVQLWGGLYSEDITSDNQCAVGAQSLFYKGDKKTVAVGNSQWNFSNLRTINYYINKTESKIADGTINGEDAMVKHYLGEGYFFRAWDYFRLLRNFGDVPIVKEMVPDNQAVLTEKSKRAPRNEVARFILEDLDKAAGMLQQNAPESGRITRDAALALKSRVALYEGTWEKYHAGTCFVPGNAKWPGNSTWPNYQFPSGSAENEVNFFLEEAIKAAQIVADSRSLDADYAGMFTNGDAFADNDEVILARYYKKGVIVHSCSAYLKGGGGCNLTRAAVNTYLMANGLPIYAENSGYQGDRTSWHEVQGRDNRLVQTIRPAGFIKETKMVDGKNVNDTIYYYKPNIGLSNAWEKATTGYELEKWVSKDEAQRKQDQCTTAVPLLRAAECYLDYIEAYYERYGNLGGNCDRYWKALRQRAGVDADYNKSIAATDLEQEKDNDLAVWSRGQKVDKTLYNIRRERRCELMAEGLRLNDLKRWRTLDNMIDYQPEGINFWEEVFNMYSAKERDENMVSQKSVSTYVRPLQINATSAAYSGYTFPKQHYLEPIPISEFLLTGAGDASKSPLYQNPGWPRDADGTADYSYNCD